MQPELRLKIVVVIINYYYFYPNNNLHRFDSSESQSRKLLHQFPR